MRVTGTLALDGQSITFEQGGDATTLTAGAAASDVTVTLPAVTSTLSTLAGTETLTNKTLTSPTLTTPALGVATATSINKVAITAPATSATITIADGATLATVGAYTTTLTSTGATGVTLPTTGTLATLAGTETFTNKTLTSPKLNENVAVTTTATTLNLITSAAGTTGTNSTNIVFSTSPALTTPTIATSVDMLAGATVKFNDNAGGEYAAIKAPATISASYTLTLPDTDGDANQVMVTDGSGVLTWTSTLLTNPMDSAGDLIYGGAAGAATKLDAGTANYLLQANGAGAPSWVTNLTTGTINGNTISTGTGTLTLGAGSTLATSATNSITLTSTGATNVTLPTTGTLATTSDKLSAFAATTSAELAGVISDETGSGALVFANTPTLVTPVLGVASATSINKVALTAPASSATLTIADGKTLTASNTLTFTGTDASSVAFGTGGTVTYTANKLSVFAATTSAELAGVISDETGSGALVFANTPTLVTPALGSATADELTVTSTGTSGLTISKESANQDSFFMYGYRDSATASPATYFVKARGTIASPTVVQDGDLVGALQWYGWSGALPGIRQGASIRGYVDGEPDTGADTTDMPMRLSLWTTPNGTSTSIERMRISQDGTTNFNTTATAGGQHYIDHTTGLSSDGHVVDIQVRDNGTARAALGMRYESTATAGVAGFVFVKSRDNASNYLWTDNSDVLRIDTTFANVGNDAGTVVGSQTSDERLKTNIQPYEGGLAEVLNLQPIRYDMFGKNTIGFGAQTTMSIIPESVYDTHSRLDPSDENSPADKLAMEYERIIPALVNAIKQLTARLEVLENA